MDNKKIELHGGNIYKLQREKNIENILDYSSNINPFGISKKLIEKIFENIKNIEKYPDPEYINLRKKIAIENKIDISNIIVGNGATEIIFLFLKIIKFKKILIVSPTFSEYEKAIKSVDDNISIDYFELEENDDFIINIEKLKKKLIEKYDLLVICNPNNPTGRFIEFNKMEEILLNCNKYNTKLMVDEAFIDFIDNNKEKSIVNTLENKENLFVVRAFTKFFAVPGVRLGYGIYFNKNLENKIELKKEIWSVNNIAETIGINSFDDKEYIEKTMKWINDEKEYMYNKLTKINYIKTYKTDVNFILVKLSDEIIKKGLDAQKIREFMILENVLIRDASNFKYLDKRFIRLAIKNRENNNIVIEKLEKIIKNI